jgi:putative FmdB family regulatory protein
VKYDYRCKECRKKFEVEVSLKKRPSPSCPNCKSKKVKKLFSPPNLKFRGSARGGGLE